MLCEYCGDDVKEQDRSRQENTIYHQVCLSDHLLKGAAALSEFRVVRGAGARVLCVAINVTYLYGQGKADKNNKQKRVIKLKELIRKASALGNSNSGFIFIHLVGLAPGDTYTGAFDEFADVKLRDLINDGSPFDDVFKKKWLSEFAIPELEPFTDILVLSVNGGHFLLTSETNTKSALDDCVIDTPELTLCRHLKNGTKFQWQKDKTEVYSLNELKQKHESRNFQAKGWFEENNRVDQIVQAVFEKLKLSNYVSAFSKLEDGGSYVLGLAEEKQKSKSGNYMTKIFCFRPVSISDRLTVSEGLIRRLSEKVLVCDYSGKVTEVADLIQIFFHCTNTTNSTQPSPQDYVVQVYVRPVDGVVFYNKLGPEAYKYDEKTHSVERLSVEECFKILKQRVRENGCLSS